MFSRLRLHFFVGIFALAPVVLTIYIVILLGGWLDSQFQPLIRFLTGPYLDRPIPGLGILLGLIAILIVGMLAPSFLGKQFFRIVERVVEKIPFVKVVHSATKQIFEAFSQSGTSRFNRVVMIPYPREDSWVVAFVTQEVESSWVPGEPDAKLAVFVPTTPNPTSGFLIFVRSQDAINLPISVEEGVKLVISAGLARPSYVMPPVLKP